MQFTFHPIHSNACVHSLFCRRNSQFIKENISGNDFDSAPEIEGATDKVFANVGNIPLGQASGATSISSADLGKYWGRICAQMTADDVAAWMMHAVLLPQVVEQFRSFGVTGCDLDELTEKVLETELGIASQLHRKKIMRAIDMKLLGLADGAFFCSELADIFSVLWMLNNGRFL